jgi:hypothetical protein
MPGDHARAELQNNGAVFTIPLERLLVIGVDAEQSRRDATLNARGPRIEKHTS